MTTATKTQRNKYRFPDRKTAEDACTRAEMESGCANRMAANLAIQTPMHRITVGDYCAIVMTHNWTGRECSCPCVMLIEKTETGYSPYDVEDAERWSYRNATKPIHGNYQADYDLRELAEQVRKLILSNPLPQA